MRCYAVVRAVMSVFARILHYPKISRHVLVNTKVSEDLCASIFRIPYDVVYLVGLSCL